MVKDLIKEIEKIIRLYELDLKEEIENRASETQIESLDGTIKGLKISLSVIRRSNDNNNN